MNLKKKVLSFPVRNSQFLKYIIFFILLCSVANVKGQVGMSIEATIANETEGIARNIVFTIATDRASPPPNLGDYQVFYSVSLGPGKAEEGVDFTRLSGVVTVPYDASDPVSVTIPVSIIDDDLVEGTEEITITLDRPAANSRYNINTIDGTAVATATITDDDIATFSVRVTDADAAEENRDVGRFLISLDKENNTGATVSLPYTLSAAQTNGADASDYTVTGQAILTFSSGQLSNQLIIVPVDDNEAEGDETLVLTLGTPSDPNFVVDAAASSAAIIISDNDCSAGGTAPVLNGNSPDFCDVDSVDLDTFYDGVAPPRSQLRWSTIVNPISQGDLLSNAEVSNATAGTYYAVFYVNSEQCASPSTPLTIAINQSPDAGTANTGLFSCNVAANGDTTFNLNSGLSNADTGGVWSYVSGPGAAINVPANGVIDFNTRASGNYVFRYTLTGAGACLDDSEQITIAVSDCDQCNAGNVAPEINPETPTVFCNVISVSSLNDYTNSAPPSGSVLRWSLTEPTRSNVPAAVSPNNPGRGTYYGYFYDSVNDCASPALQIIITLNMAPEIINAEGETRCGPGPVTFSASATGNATFNWYTEATGGTVFGTGANFMPNLNATRTLYLVATENGCPTSPRVPVTGTVQIQPSTGTATTGVSSCNNPAFGATSLDLDGTLTDEDEGNWVFTSGPDNVIPNGDNIVNFNGRPDGDYVYTFTTTGAQAPCENESVNISISVSSCDTDNDGDGLLGGLEATLGTNPNNADSDGDGINDNVEVGPDTANPLDEDDDGIIDALDSNVADSDGDGVVDQLDPANENACIPDNTNALCDEPIDLEVLKIVDNPNAVVGDEVTFTVTVTNLGPRMADSIIIGDFLESGFQYLSDEPSRGIYDVNTGQWQLADLAVEASASLSINVLVVADENEVYSNTAELLLSEPLDSNPDNDSSTVILGVESPPGINFLIEKTARLGNETRRLQELTGLVNDIETTLAVEYFIKLTNKSEEGGAVGNINVRDVFVTDDAITFEILEGNTPEGSSFDTNTGIWNISRIIEVDEEIELSYTAVFQGTGIIVNTAQIISPQQADPDNSDSTSSVTLEITIRNELNIGILYNQFSPNSDGINDVLKVNFLGEDELGADKFFGIRYDIEIYDRYGNLVYEALGLTEEEAWDGTFKGENVPDGTYFYGLNAVVTSEGDPGEVINSNGWIQLIR